VVVTGIYVDKCSTLLVAVCVFVVAVLRLSGMYMCTRGHNKWGLEALLLK
jgi:hypothetical protein